MQQVLRKWPSTMGLKDTWDLSFESCRMSLLQRHVDCSHAPFRRACHGRASSIGNHDAHAKNFSLLYSGKTPFWHRFTTRCRRRCIQPWRRRWR